MVLSLAACPESLRGDLTKWLMEISSGVFVGQVSARVREKLWHRVQENIKNGRAVLVYNTNNEQKLDFRIHGETWEPIDFDGIKLILRPSPFRLKAKQTEATHARKGFSTAAKTQAAKRFSGTTKKHLDEYVVVDIETTGLSFDRDKIIEICALRVIGDRPTESYCSLIAQKTHISKEITAHTGITSEQIMKSGKCINIVLGEFLEFLGEEPIVAHNADFDRVFLENSLAEHGFVSMSNNWVDTLSMSRSLIKDSGGYKLDQLARHLAISLDADDALKGKSMKDCMTTHLLFQKLIKMRDGSC